MIVKVRFQNPANTGRYTSTFDAFKQIVRKEQTQSLFRGIAAPMVRVSLHKIFTSVLMDSEMQAGCAFLNGIIFGTYGLLMRAQLNDSNDKPTLRQIALAGAGSGMFASYVPTMPFLWRSSHLNR